MNSLTFDNNVNQGLAAQGRLAARSREIDMVCRLHADIFVQERFMLNEVNVRIKLVRSKDPFCLMGANGDHIKVVITHASLMVRKVKLMASVFLAHAKELERGTAKYPIRRVVCKSFTTPANYLDVNHGQLPKRVVIGMIDNRAFNGERRRNPFNFEHFNLTEIGLGYIWTVSSNMP